MGERDHPPVIRGQAKAEQSQTASVVLCVDDHAANRYLRARALRAAGFEVIEAADGSSALHLAAAEKPAVIVLDIRLPDLDGFEVCRRLKSDRATRAIPVLHISAFGRLEDDLPEALEGHSDAYLREPVHPDTLVATARALIRAAEAERRQNEAEERATEAERAAAHVLESIADPIVAFDRDWRYTYVSRRAAETLGKTTDEMLGSRMWDVFPDDIDTGFQEACHRAWQECRPVTAERYSNVLGRWVENYIYPFEGGACTQWRDVTDRKLAEQALQESEARFRGLFESMREGFAVGSIICDADGNPADWRYLEINPAMAEMLGRKPEEIIGHTYRELYPAAEGEYWINGFGGVALTGKPARLEGYGSGTRRYYSGLVHSPAPRQFAAILTDVTERRESEQAVRRHREWLRVTLGSIGDAVLATDAAGNVSFLNPVAESLTGWAEGEALGRPAGEVFRIIDEQTREPVAGIIERIVSEGCIVPLANHTAVLARDGRETPVEDTAAPIRDSDGNVIGAVLVFHDVTEERRAEEALRESEAQFRTLANAIPQLCWTANPDGWITWYNQRWYEYTGATPEQMEGWGWQTVHDPETLPAVLDRWKKSIATGQPFDMVCPLRGAGGSFRPFLTRIVPIRDREGNITRWFGTNTDIGAQLEIEEALRNSEERFRALVIASSDVVYRMNPDWSEMRQLRGRGLLSDTKEPRGDWLERYIPPEDQPHVMAAVGDAIRNRSVFELEHRALRVDGASGWTFSRAVPVQNARGEVIEWFGAASDITPRKEAEAALRASEAREHARVAEMQAILDAAPVAMFVAQDPECRNIVGNPMTYEMLRLPPGANISKSAPESERPAYRVLRDGREIAPGELPAQKAAATGRPVRNYEFELLYDNGDRRLMLGEAVPLFDDQGRPRGAVGAFVDITERKRQEERFRHTQKLESVGLLAGGIAHDFNNLLTGIMGNASLIIDDVPPEAAARIREVVASAERAANLTRQLLAYSGKGAFVLRNLDVSEAVHEIASLVEFSIPKSVQLALTVQRRLPTVRMDPAHFHQILMNLVINAGEAIGEGNPGKIAVATSLAEFDNPVPNAAGSEIAPGRYVCVEVADDGPGMDEATVSKIFDPFFTTKFTGRGLGLAAVAGIVRSLKGAITLKTTPGKGTAFQVYLPVGERRAGSAEDPGVESLGAVLVVDDEATVRNFIGAVLRRRGYRVLTACDGREALTLSKAEAGAIDAMVVDIVMPIMGANELLPSIREQRPGIRLLLTSGYSESEARRLCAQYPGATFIQKPYTAQQIVAAVDRLFGVRDAVSGGT